ncbi:facilitated trehalose transporter Tret1-like isoform X3 [Pieris napi]|uniref:facilitated trehalose transporter Tret1-like isoform X3 n=1 Tax=Pieris napi TaxID=78633 RepID=UPI001FB8EA75|nr:facilitated trehalose transporter Tret1-like isoform X3 [Pieris napi]
MDDGRKLQYMVAFAVSLFTTTMGMINSWTLSMLMNFWYNQTNTKIEDVEVNWFYRMIPIGLVVGSVAAGYLCDRFGRRTTILIAVVTSTCASVLSAVATTAWMLFMTHILWTSSWGIMSSAVNIYMAEIVDPDIRGGLIVTTRCMYNFGSLLSIWIKPTSPKLLNGWLIALPILSFAAIYPIPESPYYLLKAGKEDEARKAFMRLQENFGTQEIEPGFQRMRVHAKLELENPNTFIDFLSDNIYRKAVIITFGLELIFLLSGTTAIPDHFLTILSECKINFSPWKMLVLDVVIKIVIVSILTSTMGFINTWATPMIRKFWQNETDFQFNDEDTKWFFKITPIGLLVGTVFAGYICDKFGRRTTLLTATVIAAFGSIFAALSSAAWMLYVMQGIWTFSLGIVWTVGNIYMAEIVDPDIRGGLTLATRFMFHFGSLLMIWIGEKVSYRAMNNWIIIAPLLSFAAIYPIPESPYYLLKVGKEEQARKELSRLQENVGTEDIDTQFEKMKMHVTTEMQNPSSFFKFFSNKRYRKALIITFGLKLFYISSGTAVMQGLYRTVLKEGDIELTLTEMIDIDVGIRVGCGILSALLVDRVGRRILLLWSFIGCSLSFAVIALYFGVRDYYTDMIQSIGYITFAAVIIFHISNSLGLSSIKDVIEVELFPLNVRVMAVVTLYVFGGLGYPLNLGLIEFENSSGRVSVFWTLAVIAILGFIFTCFVLPETKRKSLKEIQEMLRGDDNVSEQEMTTIQERTERFRQRAA